jgi:hypothetical protein
VGQPLEFLVCSVVELDDSMENMEKAAIGFKIVFMSTSRRKKKGKNKTRTPNKIRACLLPLGGIQRTEGAGKNVGANRFSSLNESNVVAFSITHEILG